MTGRPDAQDGIIGLADLFRDGEDAARTHGSRSPRTPTQRRRRRRGWITTGIVAVVVLAGMGGYTGWALSAPLPAPTVVSRVPAVPRPAAASIAQPTDGGAAVAISGAEKFFAAASQKPELTNGATAARPMASISKLITALVVLEKHPLKSAHDPGPTVTFGAAAHALYDQYYVQGAAIAPMPTGTRMSLHDALAATLIPSAANYADAIATWAYGSRGAFLQAAHRWLADHKMTHTTMVEPTGMSPQNVSTPADMLILARLAADNPALADITSTAQTDVPGAGSLLNTNTLLGQDGVNGLKTGNLGPGTYNLLYTATLTVGAGTSVKVAGVMLGGETHDATDEIVTRTLDSITSGFHTVPVAAAGQKIGTYTTPWGSSATMVLADDASILTWSDTPIRDSMTTTAPASFTSGETVGTVTWKAGPKTVTSKVRVDGTITPPTAWWRLTHPGALG